MRYIARKKPEDATSEEGAADEEAKEEKPPKPTVVEERLLLDGTRTIKSVSYVAGGRRANHMVTDQDETIRLTHGSMMQMTNRVGFSLSTYNSPTRTEEPPDGVKKGQGTKLPAKHGKKMDYIQGLIIDDAKALPLLMTVKTYSDGDQVLVGSRRPVKPKPEPEDEKAEAAEEPAEAPAEE